ncbi:MAG: tRNA (adenosine(37)-N6)-threonylcarbamoyltransferase complex ATPase subunit type 1 TsaE [Clostridiales bacterium]|nr:tRNA (adenosine(37)-N6)-threonylcarbamoyltransferase complex ATPase subunit type 1 TsaE [Clostridiales bacterium]
MGRVYESFSAKDTADIGREIAREAKPGEVYALVGDLGTGKTAFSGGFAKGLGITEPVTSPTFTIVMEYNEGRLPLYHFDVYRLADESELDEIGFFEYIDGEGVSLIEWADLIRDLLPEGTVMISIAKDLSKGFDYRRIEIEEL